MRLAPVAAAALFATQAFAADKEKIAVVELDAPPGMLGLSTQVTKAVLTEAAKQKRAVITPDELRDKLGNKTINELVKCADRPQCAAEKLTALGATKAVIGKLDRDEKNYVLQLWLLDLNAFTVITDVDRSILIASRRFQKDVEAAVPGFLKGEREARGTLVINATVPNAQVTLNGEFMGVAPFTITLKPGKYEVKVEKKAYLPVKRFVAVEPNQKTVEEIRMLLIPGEKPEDELRPLVKQPGQEGGDQGGGFRPSAPTIVAGVATLAAAGVGLGFGLKSSGETSALTKGYDPATDRYTGTRAQALQAGTDATIANVSFGVAGAALIATVILIVVDVRTPADGDTQVEVTPTATPGGGGLILGGRF